MQTTIKPHAKLTGLAAMHWFSLANAVDRIYNVAGAPVGTPGTGIGTDLGQELDLIATYAYNPNFDVQFGYSWFWYGQRVSTTGGSSIPHQDATQLYIQTSLRY